MTTHSGSEKPSPHRALSSAEITGSFGQLVTDAVMDRVKFRNGIITEFGSALENPARSPEKEFIEAVQRKLQPPSGGQHLLKTLRVAIAGIVVEAHRAEKLGLAVETRSNHYLQATRYADSALQALRQFVPAAEKAAGPSVPVTIAGPGQASMDALVERNVVQTLRKEHMRVSQFLGDATLMVHRGQLSATQLGEACREFYDSVVPGARLPSDRLGQADWSSIMTSAIQMTSQAAGHLQESKKEARPIEWQIKGADPVPAIREGVTAADRRSSAMAYSVRAIGVATELVQKTLEHSCADNLPPHVQASVYGRPAALVLDAVCLAPVASRVNHLTSGKPKLTFARTSSAPASSIN